MSFSRFDGTRNHFNTAMPSAPMNGSQFPYDMNASQTWNPNGNAMQSFGGNHSGFMTSAGGLAGQSRLKPSRGRAVLPNVRTHRLRPCRLSNHGFAGLAGPESIDASLCWLRWRPHGGISDAA